MDSQAVFLLHKNASLAFDSRWSQKDHLKKEAMDNAAERHKGGRPRKAVKRTQATGVRFTEIEYNIIKKKALDAGQRLTVYVRNMALNGHVIASLSSEEKQQLRMLSGIANNVNQMAKKAHEEGLLKAAISFSQIMQELEQILGRVKA